MARVITKNKQALTTSLGAALNITARCVAAWAVLDSNVAWYVEYSGDASMVEYIPAGSPWVYMPPGNGRLSAADTVKVKVDSGTANLTLFVETVA